MKKILFYVGSMGGGGAERQVVEILKRLDRRRFQPALYLDHRQGPLLDEIPKDVQVFSFWDEFAGTWQSKLHYLLGTTQRARWQHLARTIRANQIQLLYNHTHLATLDAAEASKLTGIPRISVCVCDPLQEVKTYARQSIQQEILRIRKAYETADCAVAISEGIRDSMIDDLGLRSNNLQVLYYMVDFEEAIRQSQLQELDWADDRFHLLTVGRLAPQKGHRDFIQALAELVHHRGHHELLWHVVGTGPLEAELKQDISDHKLQNHVDFAGFQANPYPYYQHADLFCLTSLYEGFGLVVAEALACGLPVATTQCPSGPAEIVGHGKFGHLIPVGEPRKMADAVADCIKNFSDWKARAEAGRSFVRETFSFHVGLNRLENLFDSVIEGQV